MARIGELIGPNGEVMHPRTSAEVVYLEDGRTVEQVLSDDVDYGNVVFQDNSYKFDNDVEDDFAKAVIIKGQTYQNILPEPSTHVLTNNKEMFKVNEGLDPNVEIVDGVSKSAILSGNTKYRDISSNKIYDSYETATQVWSTNKYKLWCAQDAGTTSELNGTITSGGDIVTLDFHVINHSTYKLTGNCTYKKIVFYDNNQTFISSTRTAATTDDLVVNNIPSNARYVRFAFFPHEDNTGSCSIVDENNNPINIRQIQLISCKMPVLKTTGKNLCDTSKYIHGGLSNNNMIFSKNKYRSYYMKCKPSTVYTVKVENSNNRFGVGSSHLFSEDTTFTLNKYWTTPSSNVTGQTLQYTVTTTEKDEYLYVYVANNGVFNPDSRVQVEEGSVATAYEPYKSNILSTPEEVVLRSLPNGVCDTLNLNTGEYVQRIGEVVLDGSSDENWNNTSNADNVETLTQFNIGTAIFNGALPKTASDESVVRGAFIQNMFGIQKASVWTYQEGEACAIHMPNPTHNSQAIQAKVLRSRLSSQDVAGWRALLQNTPWVLQYELATPIVKTVDLSSSGNWDKVILNGNETWSVHSNWSGGEFLAVQTQVANKLGGGLAFTDSTQFKGMSWKDSSVNGQPSKECVRYDSSGAVLYVFIKKSRLTGETVNDFKKWLQENPIAVWYQTATHQDSTQVKQPIFFKDGHIQLSSGADNSLIPTLDYQAKTSNSYVMDLMKANTRYTMKAKSASGTFTIDGTSYGAGTNGTFTTPSSMTNKLLVMSNKTNEEVMILEGDVTDKTIPYFKGFKSAFEDEDKIEVLSTSQNILDTSKIVQGDLLNSGIIASTGGSADNWCYTVDYIPCPSIKQELHAYRTVDGKYSSTTSFIYFFNDSKQLLGSRVQDTIFKIPVGAKYMRIMVHKGDMSVDRIGIMVTSSNEDRMDQSIGGLQNSTKIPLLSPLRSLPNGVCDELIIDRMKNKATLIQRIDYIQLSGEHWTTRHSYSDMSETLSFFATHPINNFKNANYGMLSQQFQTYQKSAEALRYETQPYIWNGKTGGALVYVWMELSKLVTDTTSGVQRYFNSNPLDLYYELATPVVTEVDLEGFPYIYKDGHIFLNGEITPTVGIEYSINQGHRIEGQVETLQRHEKQFTQLERYFADLIYSDYNFALLRFSEKLRQQEGDV